MDIYTYKFQTLQRDANQVERIVGVPLEAQTMENLENQQKCTFSKTVPGQWDSSLQCDRAIRLSHTKYLLYFEPL